MRAKTNIAYGLSAWFVLAPSFCSALSVLHRKSKEPVRFIRR
jgi:hypothetical protein